jgi:cobalt/nickel transport system permease protein
MHLPDGFLTNREAISFAAVSAASVAFAARRLRTETAGPLVPLMGVTGAFVFAAQMLNFPVLGGTSGHLVGGALLAILLGPMAGFLVMTTVVAAQALFLQDGGIVALGANVFNIGAMTVFTGYGVFRLLGGRVEAGRRTSVAAFSAAWVSLVLSAATCALMLSLSGTVPLRVGLPAMAGYHAIVGIIEGALTAAVVSFILRVRPDLLRRPAHARFGLGDFAGSLALVGVPVLILVLAGSSSLPDPLETVLQSSQPGAAAPESDETLLSTGRMLDYALRAALFAAALAAVYLVARFGRKGDSRP